jgi:hypothetical protein
VPRELKDRHGVVVTYDRVYKGAVDATMPIEQGANGRYFVRESRLPDIAKALEALAPREEKTAA